MNDTREIRVHREAVARCFGFLKSIASLPELWAQAIPLAESAGYLLPVCELHARDEALIETLARWREENAYAYPTQFPVSHEGTRRWLRERLLDARDRILFLIVDPLGRPLGHVGFASALAEDGSIELDNLVRGSFAGRRDVARLAVEALLDWAETTLAPSAVRLRVLASLPHVIRFDERLGFREEKRTPLRRVARGEASELLPIPIGDAAPPDDEFVHMARTYRSPWTGEETILTAGPSITGLESAYVADAVRSGWNASWSNYLTRFERAFADTLGRKYAIATSSCTGALHLSFLALGIGPGDEVIVPELTWVATANAVRYTGATPVFADVEPDTWCLDPESFERHITPRTRAVAPVHLYGHPARMTPIVEIARRRGIGIVEDAAPAIGAECDGVMAGRFGDFACFSFQGAKLLVTGEGGMLVTDDDGLYERVRSLWDQGRDPNRTFWIADEGWKYKMSNLQAALGLAQLERIEELIERKRRIFRWYDEGLAGARGVRLMRGADYARGIYWMTSVLVEEEAGIDRDGMRERLRERRVDTRPVFPAISQYPIWPNRRPPAPNALRIGERGLNLPSGVLLRREQVDYVCAQIREILDGVHAHGRAA